MQVRTTPAARWCRRRARRHYLRQSSAPAIGSASRATTRSRQTFSPRSWQASTGRESTISISCNRASFSRPISICSSAASRVSSTSSYSGPQGAALARALVAGKIELGAIHTYIELFARYFMDLTPHVALIAARQADRDGNLYTGPNTEDTPTIVEATAFKSGIVVAQVNEVVDKVPRFDIPGDQVDFIVEADKHF